VTGTVTGTGTGTRTGPEEAVEEADEAVAETIAEPTAEPAEEQSPEPPSLELEQLQEAWQRSVLPAVEQRSIPTASMLREARPTALEADTLTLEFPANAAFHRKLAEDEKNARLLHEALYEVTGRRLALEFELGEGGGAEADADEQPVSEEDLLALLKQEFDAREVDE
jgi:hypothetical protein